ncbi:MAG TPA: undecaprenyl-diphosphate phosphatase [Solirubrobacteraceae bacterium]
MLRDRAPLPLRHAIVLGLAHGPTELLPISSSAHTILIPWLAGWPYDELDPELRKSFEVALHAGTAAALLADLRAIESHPGLAAVLRRATGAQGFPASQALLVALSFIPPAVVGYTFEQPLQRRLSGLHTIAAGLLFGGVAMALADSRPGDGARTLAQAGWFDGLLLGLAQTCALVPGISRSGAVLSVARARGFSRIDSGTLARRIGLPVILGAGALKTARLFQNGAPAGGGRTLALGGTASFISTLAATRLLRGDGNTRHTGSLLPYSIYRGLLAALVIRRLRRAHNRST